MQDSQDNITNLAEQENKYTHGGNIKKLAERAGCPSSELLDFSANIKSPRASAVAATGCRQRTK